MYNSPNYSDSAKYVIRLNEFNDRASPTSPPTKTSFAWVVLLSVIDVTRRIDSPYCTTFSFTGM